MAKSATPPTAPKKRAAEPPKQVVLAFDESTYRRIQDELLPAEKRKLTGQLEYLLLKERDKAGIIQVVNRFRERTQANRTIKVAVKISPEEYWKGQEEAVTARISFRDYALALLEDWADQVTRQKGATKGSRALAATG